MAGMGTPAKGPCGLRRSVTNSAHPVRPKSQISLQIADMHPPHVREEAMRLIAQGLNDCEVSRRIGVPRSTVREWRRPPYVPRVSAPPRSPCLRCWLPAKPIRFTPDDYCELLGLYLGDGCISPGARTARLRISLDSKYPTIIREARELLERSFPANSVDAVPFHNGSAVNVSVYSSHLVCLFPQHGPGPKHKRKIALEPWQASLVEQAPWAFIRGCIRSDGWRVRQQDGPLRVLELRLLQHVAGHRRDVHRCLRDRGCPLSGDQEPAPRVAGTDQPPSERGADARARRSQGVTLEF